ncbi:MAG: urease accessory protein UreD [Verrucomicrobia bacterium]|nr:urease accessory protein UreD [Verrucomicrobiota bacterium]
MRTVLVENRHFGPLLVQKAIYPEGEQICHAVIVHPPGGIAGGDELTVEIDLQADSNVVITTPAAAKWYKAPRHRCRQETTVRLAERSTLDWLPQENIFYNATHVSSNFILQLEPGATAIGWDMGLLGRGASGEQWLEGSLRSVTSIERGDGSPLWVERLLLDAPSSMLEACQCLSGFVAFGTLWAIGSSCMAAVANELHSHLPLEAELRAGATSLPGGILLLRVLAQDIERLRQMMTECWLRLRPLVHGLPPQRLRLWAT